MPPKKEKTSMFMEPYHIMKMLGSGAMLFFTMLKVGILQFKKDDSIDSDAQILLNTEKYKSIQQELSEPFAPEAWRRFLITGLIIEAFLLIMSLMHFALGSWFIGLELTFLTCVSVLFFGYKPWIIRNKQYVDFLTYLTKIEYDPRSLLLWYSIKGMD